MMNRANQEWPEGTVVELSPYSHELNSEGTDCASDCPACIWVDCQTIQKGETT
jgi:hypothetical protein